MLILDRPRHADLVQQVRDAGARIRFISDGDVAGAIETAKAGAPVDIMMGIGGTPEGVIAGGRAPALLGVELCAHSTAWGRSLLDLPYLLAWLLAPAALLPCCPACICCPAALPPCCPALPCTALLPCRPALPCCPAALHCPALPCCPAALHCHAGPAITPRAAGASA